MRTLKLDDRLAWFAKLSVGDTFQVFMDPVAPTLDEQRESRIDTGPWTAEVIDVQVDIEIPQTTANVAVPGLIGGVIVTFFHRDGQSATVRDARRDGFANLVWYEVAEAQEGEEPEPDPNDIRDANWFIGQAAFHEAEAAKYRPYTELHTNHSTVARLMRNCVGHAMPGVYDKQLVDRD